jgi:outer membrane protein assembly factor BamB
MAGAGLTGRGRVPRRVVVLGLAGILVLLAGAAGVAYQVFRPHDDLTRPTVPYPSAVMITDERPFSELRAAPLVIEGRLRVYAETWRIWADAPVGERYETTPYWAYRRWPAQVVGVVNVTTPAGPYVISQWSDGELVALDARAGSIAWRASAPVAQTSYDGRRTGASVVYEPRSLLTVRTGDQSVVITLATGTVHAFDAASGAPLWQRAVPGGCEPMAWTGAGLLAVPGCTGFVVSFFGARDGASHGTWQPSRTVPATPALCALGRSDCRLVTTGAKAWLLRPDATLAAVPPLEPHAVLAGDRVVYPTATGIVARRLTDGAPLWTWNGKGTLVAADTVGVYVLTADHTVLGLSPVTGRLSVLGCASSRPNEDWQLGHVHTTDGSYLALERITHAAPSSKDSLYYYGPRPVALVELYPPTKLPVWSGKFAACAPVS